MQKGLLLRLGFCLGVLSLCLYSYQSKQNELTHLKILLPQLEIEICAIREETQRLQFEIDRVESPTRLIELAHHPEFRHLKHPLMKEVLNVPEGIALQTEKSNSDLW
jgi:hypothetical protein